MCLLLFATTGTLICIRCTQQLIEVQESGLAMAKLSCPWVHVLWNHQDELVYMIPTCVEHQTPIISLVCLFCYKDLWFLRGIHTGLSTESPHKRSTYSDHTRGITQGSMWMRSKRNKEEGKHEQKEQSTQDLHQPHSNESTSNVKKAIQLPVQVNYMYMC